MRFNMKIGIDKNWICNLQLCLEVKYLAAARATDQKNKQRDSCLKNSTLLLRQKILSP